MKTKKILAMLLSAMIVMSASAVSVSAEVCDGTNHNFSNGVCTNDDCEATCNCDNTGATCTTPGTCSVCGKEGEPLDHTELVEKEAAVQATCTTAGKNAVMGCSRCDDINEGGEETDVLGHNYTVDVEGKPATCTEDGYTAHKKCSRCDSVDEKETIGATGHTEVPHEAKAPTCTEVGWDAYVTCSRCDYTTYSEKAAKGHDEAFYDAKTPTCTEDGWDAYVMCSKCSYNTYSEKPATGHTYENGECTVCGASEPACEHAVGTPATCEDPAVCSKCEESYGEPLGHNLVEVDDESNKAATCGEAGSQKYECDRNGCDHTETKVLSATGNHNYKDGKCTVCGADKPSSGSSSSSSSTPSNTKATVDTKAEANKISTAKAGSKVEVKIEGNTVPAAYVQAALSSKATVVVDYGTYAWEISDVTEAKAVDLSINTDAKHLVNQNELKDLKGDSSNVIDIKHNGKLGFKGTLKYNVKKENAGKFVNLYFYNPTTKKLELKGSTKIGADGNVFLPFTHCSTYVLNITATPASNELFEDFSAGESATVVEETLPVGNAPAATEAPAQTEAAANPATGNSAAALVAIPVAIAAAAIISKKR